MLAQTRTKKRYPHNLPSTILLLQKYTKRENSPNPSTLFRNKKGKETMERRKNESWKKEEENRKKEQESWKKEEENRKEEQESWKKEEERRRK